MICSLSFQYPLLMNPSDRYTRYCVVIPTYNNSGTLADVVERALKETPSTPVSVIGLSETPLAGDRFMAFPTEAEAKEIAMKRKLAKDEAEKAKSGGAKLEDLLANTR